MSGPLRLRLLRLAIVAGVGLLVVACASQPFRYNGAIIASENPNVREMPTTKVALKDRVVVVTHVDWDESGRSGGKHVVRWNWYEGNALIVERSRTLEFATTPFRFFRSISAADLGLGQYRVEVLVDGTKVDVQKFDVVAN